MLFSEKPTTHITQAMYLSASVYVLFRNATCLVLLLKKLFGLYPGCSDYLTVSDKVSIDVAEQMSRCCLERGELAVEQDRLPSLAEDRLKAAGPVEPQVTDVSSDDREHLNVVFVQIHGHTGSIC